MVLLLLVLLLSLLSPGSLCGAVEPERGCRSWTVSGSTDVCCTACHPGNHIVHICGVDPRALCTPCEEDTFTEDPTVFECQPCTQCVGVQTTKQACTSTRDTECDCKAGYRCGDRRCTFCVEECGKGEEPADKRSCRQCPPGTFNDQIHQKCKPWRTSCPGPEQVVLSGNAVSDHECISGRNSTPPAVVVMTSKKTEAERGGGESTAGLVATLLLAAAVFLLVVIGVVFNRIVKKKKKKTFIIQTATPDTPSDTPSDDLTVDLAVDLAVDLPDDLADDLAASRRSLVSFRRPQQEQGSSSETLASQESKAPLIV